MITGAGFARTRSHGREAFCLCDPEPQQRDTVLRGSDLQRHDSTRVAQRGRFAAHPAIPAMEARGGDGLCHRETCRGLREVSEEQRRFRVPETSLDVTADDQLELAAHGYFVMNCMAWRLPVFYPEPRRSEMKLTQLFRDELDREATRTRRALEHVPSTLDDWKPHPK